MEGKAGKKGRGVREERGNGGKKNREPSGSDGGKMFIKGHLVYNSIKQLACIPFQ